MIGSAKKRCRSCFEANPDLREGRSDPKAIMSPAGEKRAGLAAEPCYRQMSRWRVPAQKRKARRMAGLRLPEFLRKSGAGEGIRTLDPDLGKVVLYP
jgi:hypothetical protein